MVQDEKTIAQSALVTSNNVGHDRVSHTLVFYVNGKEVVDDNVDPQWTLLWYLRNKLNLTGTKLGCAEGGCGACTVMISKLDRATEIITGYCWNETVEKIVLNSQETKDETSINTSAKHNTHNIIHNLSSKVI